MTHLVIGLDHFKSIGDEYVLALDDYQQCKLASDSQQSFLDTGAALQLLSTAFLNLRNLYSIEIRDFNSRTRYRDSTSINLRGANHVRHIPAWKSYGHAEVPQWSRHLNDEYGGGLVAHNADSGSFVDRVFKVLLAALDQKSPIRGLETLFRNGRLLLTDGAFAVNPILDRTANKLPLVLSGLTKLHLDVDFASASLSSSRTFMIPTLDPFDKPGTIEEVCDPATTNLRKFLALTPNVTWLRLNGTADSRRPISPLLSWLALNPDKPFGSHAETGWSDTNPRPVSLPLRRLDLGKTVVDSETLGRVLRKFDKLEQLSFRTVHLLKRSVQDHQGAQLLSDDDQNISNAWARFFRKVLVSAPSLKTLLLMEVYELDVRKPNRPERIDFSPAVIGDSIKTTLALPVTGKASLEDLADRTWTRRAREAVRLASLAVGNENTLVDTEGSVEVDDVNEEEEEDEGGDESEDDEDEV